MSMSEDSPKRTPGLLVGRACALSGLGVLLLASAAGAQIPQEFVTTPLPTGEGWLGFTDLDFLFSAFLNLILAATLGAVIGYHPRRIRTSWRPYPASWAR
jgi:hypothetical protein